MPRITPVQINTASRVTFGGNPNRQTPLTVPSYQYINRQQRIMTLLNDIRTPSITDQPSFKPVFAKDCNHPVYTLLDDLLSIRRRFNLPHLNTAIRQAIKLHPVYESLKGPVLQKLTLPAASETPADQRFFVLDAEDDRPVFMLAVLAELPRIRRDTHLDRGDLLSQPELPASKQSEIGTQFEYVMKYYGYPLYPVHAEDTLSRHRALGKMIWPLLKASTFKPASFISIRAEEAQGARWGTHPARLDQPMPPLPKRVYTPPVHSSSHLKEQPKPQQPVVSTKPDLQQSLGGERRIIPFKQPQETQPVTVITANAHVIVDPLPLPPDLREDDDDLENYVPAESPAWMLNAQMAKPELGIGTDTQILPKRNLLMRKANTETSLNVATSDMALNELSYAHQIIDQVMLDKKYVWTPLMQLGKRVQIIRNGANLSPSMMDHLLDLESGEWARKESQPNLLTAIDLVILSRLAQMPLTKFELGTFLEPQPEQRYIISNHRQGREAILSNLPTHAQRRVAAQLFETHSFLYHLTLASESDKKAFQTLLTYSRSQMGLLPGTLDALFYKHQSIVRQTEKWGQIPTVSELFMLNGLYGNPFHKSALALETVPGLSNSVLADRLWEHRKADRNLARKAAERIVHSVTQELIALFEAEVKDHEGEDLSLEMSRRLHYVAQLAMRIMRQANEAHIPKRNSSV